MWNEGTRQTYSKAPYIYINFKVERRNQDVDTVTLEYNHKQAFFYSLRKSVMEK